MANLSPDLSEETQGQYPDLMRARNLYLTLFKDQSALVHLGYIGTQVTRAYNVLSLLPEAGKIIENVSGKPELTIASEKSEDEDIVISHLPNKKGFSLVAFEDLWASKGLVSVLLEDRHNGLFEELPDKIAYIGLFAHDAKLTNLDFLVKQLSYDLTFTQAPLGFHSETGLTQPLGKMGVMGTYKAAWVDEEAKHEFVVKIDVPENKGLGSLWVTFRKLNPVSDSRGSMTPFGEKPNSSQSKVMKVLEEGRARVISGVLAPVGVGLRK